MTAQDLTRLWSSILCKTHKWLLVVQSDPVKWCGNGMTLQYGANAPLADLLVMISSDPYMVWAIYALTEPELPEAEAPLAFDFIYPLQEAMLGTKATPKEIMQFILNYIDAGLANIGRTTKYRGVPEMSPDAHATPGNIMDACNRGKALCGSDVQIQRPFASKISSKTGSMSHIWYSRGTQELLPMYYMQKIYGVGDLYWTYCVGATDSLDDADAVLQAEIEALEACLQNNDKAPHALVRMLSITMDEYDDVKSEESPLQGEHYRSLNSLGRKLMVLANRPSSSRYYPMELETHAVDLKKRLLKAHTSDALSDIVAIAWPEVATWEC